MNTCTQAGVANKFFGGWKAGNIADRCQHSHGAKHPNARQLHQKRDLVGPWRTGTQAAQFSLDLSNQPVDSIEERYVLSHAQVFGGHERKRIPPGPVVGGKDLSSGRNKVMAMEYAMQAIARLRALLH